jgi:hypothetical protein
MFPKLGLGKNPLEPKVLINGKLPQFENLSLKGVLLGKGVSTHGKLEPPNILLPLA